MTCDPGKSIMQGSVDKSDSLVMSDYCAVRGDRDSKADKLLAVWLKEICTICKRPDDEKSMLVCESEDCGHMYHTYCLNPRLEKVPSGSWYCPDCTDEHM